MRPRPIMAILRQAKNITVKARRPGQVGDLIHYKVGATDFHVKLLMLSEPVRRLGSIGRDRCKSSASLRFCSRPLVCRGEHILTGPRDGGNYAGQRTTAQSNFCYNPLVRGADRRAQ